MKFDVLKNPIVLFRGSDISKSWYTEMVNDADALRNKLFEIKTTDERVEQMITSTISKIETAFAQTKDVVYLNLKRDLFNKRIEKTKNYIDKNLSEEVINSLKQVLELAEQKKNLLIAYGNEYTKVYSLNRSTLQEKVSNEELKKSITFFNESIYKKLDNYILTKSPEHNKKLKKLDFFLLKILSRGSMKTSPFSYLTKTGLVSDEEREFEKQAFCEINHSVILKLVHHYLRTNEDALQKIPVKVENFGSRNGKVYYVSQHDIDQSNKVFETSDKFVEYTLEQDLINYFEENKLNVITFQQFKEFASSIEKYRDKELSLYSKLVELKLLRQQVNISNNRGILLSINEMFATYGIGEEIRKQIEDLHEELVAFEQKDAIARLENWNRINELVDELNVENKKIGKEFLYEDVIFKHTKQDLVTSKIKPSFLKMLSEFILLFDVNIRVQYEIGQLFRQSYNQEIVKLTNSNLLNNIFFSKIHNFYPYYQDQHYRYDDALAEEIHLLDNLRDEFLAEFKSLMAGVDQKTDHLDLGNLILKYTEQIPQHIKNDIDVSYTLFMQYAGEDSIVLNDVYDGHEKFISRFKDFFESAYESEEYVDYTNKTFKENNYYEIDELFGFNGGIHERKDLETAKLEIGYEQFSDKNGHKVNDIQVRYNEQTRKIEFTDNNDETCKIVYKSSLVPIFLPGILSVILHLFQSGRLNFDIPTLVQENEYVPRITVDNIILSRKKWGLHFEEIKGLIENLEKQEELYIALNEHFSEKGLPKRFFLKYHRMEGSFKVEKPLFFDLEVPLLVRHFVNEIKEGAYIEEVLPDVHMPLNEYLVEYSFVKERVACLI